MKSATPRRVPLQDLLDCLRRGFENSRWGRSGEEAYVMGYGVSSSVPLEYARVGIKVYRVTMRQYIDYRRRGEVELFAYVRLMPDVEYVDKKGKPVDPERVKEMVYRTVDEALRKKAGFLNPESDSVEWKITISWGD